MSKISIFESLGKLYLGIDQNHAISMAIKFDYIPTNMILEFIKGLNCIGFRGEVQKNWLYPDVRYYLDNKNNLYLIKMIRNEHVIDQVLVYSGRWVCLPPKNKKVQTFLNNQDKIVKNENFGNYTCVLNWKE